MTETLWAGEFGDAYTERNLDAAKGRGRFWTPLVEKYEIGSALEVGCNAGANLVHLDNATGVDVNQHALDKVPDHIPTVNASATRLPFDDRSFDLTFTIGVLIHLDLTDLHKAMRELVRCSDRYVLCGEYWAPNEQMIVYRGRRQALWRRDFKRIYLETFPLRLVDEGFLNYATWDKITWWLFERS